MSDQRDDERGDEARLREAMRVLATDDARTAPPFETSWARARAHRTAGPRFAGALGAAALAAAAMLTLTLLPRGPSRLEPMPAPTVDREPLRALLVPPRGSVIARREETPR